VTAISAPSKIDSLKLAAASAIQPLAGMIEIDGTLRIRRAGFCKHAEIHCWKGHNIRSRPGERPWENVMRCGHRDTRNSAPCEARIYVLRVRTGTYFCMDVNMDEDNHIEFREMELDDLIVWFGITFPPPVKWCDRDALIASRTV
jgi:hypothetical protein